MNLFEIDQKTKLHNRHIEISTYDYNEKSIIMEGRLIEGIMVAQYDIKHVKRPPREIHHMVIRMLIEVDSFIITEIACKMPTIPQPDCEHTAQSVSKIKGMQIGPGFSAKVRKKIGRAKGCAHLTTLVLAITTAFIQGFWTHQTRQPLPPDIMRQMIEVYLTDGCWVFREDGPLLKELLPHRGDKT